MAGATNRALKAAGLPKATIKTLRVESGGGLTLKSAIQVAQSRGLDVGQAHAHIEKREAKAAVKASQQQQQQQQPATAAASSRRGGPVAGRITNLRSVNLPRMGNLDVRVTPSVLREYVAPNLSALRTKVDRKARMADLATAIRQAAMSARGADGKSAATLKFSVNAAGEGSAGTNRDFHFKARRLAGKGKDGKALVAVNLVSMTTRSGVRVPGAAEKYATADRAAIQSAQKAGASVARQGGAVRIQSAPGAAVPFKHRGETVYAVRDGQRLSRVVREDGSVVRNREAIKRGARVVRADLARGAAGPSKAMQRGETRRAAAANAVAAAAATARRQALVSAANRRGRVNPGVIYRGQSAATGKHVGAQGVEGSFAHQGKAYSVKSLGGSVSIHQVGENGRGSFVSKPKKALRQRAERVVKAIVSRVKTKGAENMRARSRAVDEY